MTQVDTVPGATSPFASLALLGDASFAVARDVHRTAVGAFRFGSQCTSVVVSAITSAPVIGPPLTQLARQGAEQRQADTQRAGLWLARAEPVITQVLERVVGLIPIDAVLAQIDVDALLGRIDVNALMARIDLAGLMSHIELGDMIHDSTTNIASDVRDGVRSGAVSVDGRLARLVDRLVRRGSERDLVVPGYAMGGTIVPGVA